LLHTTLDDLLEFSFTANRPLEDLIIAAVAVLRCSGNIPGFDNMQSGHSEDLAIIAEEIYILYSHRQAVHSSDTNKLIVAMAAVTNELTGHLLAATDYRR
jgi:hypothetical protein